MNNKEKVKRTERGWAGHFIGAPACYFRRNTLLEYKDIKIVVSTIGNMWIRGKIEEIGCNRYYETMAFHSKKDDHRYHDIDVTRQVYFNSEWAIDETDADDKANDMHEKVVEEITKGLLNGNRYEYE